LVVIERTSLAGSMGLSLGPQGTWKRETVPPPPHPPNTPPNVQRAVDVATALADVRDKGNASAPHATTKEP